MCIRGRVLTLTSLDLGVTRTYTCDNQTEYEFTRLQGGDYVLSAALPDGQMFALPGGDSLFSDGTKASDELAQNVSEGLTAVIAPIGVMPATSLEVIAFHDSNFNGLADEGEPHTGQHRQRGPAPDGSCCRREGIDQDVALATELHGMDLSRTIGNLGDGTGAAITRGRAPAGDNTLSDKKERRLEKR